jgi:hypothetical protein
LSQSGSPHRPEKQSSPSGSATTAAPEPASPEGAGEHKGNGNSKADQDESDILSAFCGTVKAEDDEGPRPDGRAWDLDDLVVDTASQYSVTHYGVGQGIQNAKSLLGNALSDEEKRISMSIMDMCAARGIPVSSKNRSITHPVSEAISLARYGPPPKASPTPQALPSELEEQVAREAYCRALEEHPGVEVTELIPQANQIFEADPRVSPERREVAMGHVFAELVNGTWRIALCRARNANVSESAPPEPTPSLDQDPAYDLAVIQAGHRVDPADPSVAHFQEVLNQLSRSYGETPQQIADKTVKAQQMLAAKGLDDSFDDIIHAMITISTAKARISYADALASYIVLREGGEGKG